MRTSTPIPSSADRSLRLVTAATPNCRASSVTVTRVRSCNRPRMRRRRSSSARPSVPSSSATGFRAAVRCLVESVMQLSHARSHILPMGNRPACLRCCNRPVETTANASYLFLRMRSTSLPRDLGGMGAVMNYHALGFDRCPTLIASIALFLGSAAAEGQEPPAAPETTNDQAATSTSEDSDEIETVVVRGTRASLTESRDLKRDAGIVQDSIVAEDLGRFPDANVADSLSHITGITISRTRGGEGQYVNVRGLGPQYSIVTLNGRILATDGDGREFAFDVLPSEVISGADVYKSADASQIEGSIGGTINLSTARPLEQRGRHLRLSLEGDYNDLSEEDGYKVGGVYS